MFVLRQLHLSRYALLAAMVVALFATLIGTSGTASAQGLSCGHSIAVIATVNNSSVQLGTVTKLCQGVNTWSRVQVNTYTVTSVINLTARIQNTSSPSDDGETTVNGNVDLLDSNVVYDINYSACGLIVAYVPQSSNPVSSYVCTA
ncbi:hypothetical protein [Tengunoibacter tsumagoiensis]|uniref:Spore coat protein U domain-containing protein n=1 Tax=Tengunoibacter tsumagoiensis TaxID=2014871 RepID=A0A402A9H2_9CHLR|nr:hypothetical protein [Tengunoibacter tsumagoiensis]GCE15793.1 hypothetical protein KTT_56520 [Tengunoibacter tsumagoiensis]